MDPYDNGTSKYSTAQSIYEALQVLVNAAEEMGIMGELFQDVSYDNADYYYIDKGGALLEKFEEACDHGSSRCGSTSLGLNSTAAKPMISSTARYGR